MRKRVSCLGDLCAEVARASYGAHWVAFVTLTYRPGVEWEARHISAYLQSVRNHLREKGVKPLYLWVAELQARGAVHYHVLFWLPVGVMLPKPDQSGWVHGMSNIQKSRGGGVGYLLKYCRKGSVRLPFPRNARVYGFGGLGWEQREKANWHCLPRYQRRRCYWFESVRRCRGGWVSSLGDFFPGFIRPYFMKVKGWDCDKDRAGRWGEVAAGARQGWDEFRGAGSDWSDSYRAAGPQVCFAY